MAAETQDATAKESSQSLSDQIAKAVNVTIDGEGKLKLYSFPRGDFYFGTNKFYPSLAAPFWALSTDPQLRTGPLGPGGFPTVPSPPGEGVPVQAEDANFGGNARLSRIGLLYTGEKAKWLGDADTEGCIEMDFYNTIENPLPSRETPRIRLGYVKATWGQFSVLVGLNWDIIAPLLPTINEDLCMWNAGNMGDRRPQIRLNWDDDLGNGQHFIFTVGDSSVDAVNRSDLDGNGYFDGEAAGFPGFQGRTAYRVPTPWCNQFAELGIWGHYSARRTDVGIGLSQRSYFNSYSVGGDWEIPLTERLKLRGEAWYGSDLDDYRGGIDQGINPIVGSEIRAWGGWTELLAQPFKWYQLSVGATLDHPFQRDLAGMTFDDLPRTANYTYYVGDRFPVGGGLTLGLDFEFWHTDYLYLSEGRADRFKFWAMLTF